MADWLDQYPLDEGGGTAVASAPAASWLDQYPVDEEQPQQPSAEVARRTANRQSAVDTYQQRWGGAGPIAKNAMAVTLGAGRSIMSPLVRMFDSEKADQFNYIADAAEQGAGGGIVAKGLRSAATTLPGMIVAGNAGGPYGAIGAGMLQEADQAYTAGQDAGMTPIKAAGYAAGQGVIEGGIASVFQRFGMGALEDVVGRSGKQAVVRGAWNIAKDIGKKMGYELGEEELTEVSHKIAEKASGVDPEKWTWGQVVDVLGTTAVATMASMGAVEGASRLAQGQERAGRLADLKTERAAQQTANTFNDAAWGTEQMAQSAVDHLMRNGLPAEKIAELAANPTSKAFEDLNLGSRKNRTMPTADARRAFGENARKYLESFNATQAAPADAQAAEGNPAAAADQQPAPATPPAEVEITSPVGPTKPVGELLAEPRTGQQFQKDVASSLPAESAPPASVDMFGQPIVQDAKPIWDMTQEEFDTHAGRTVRSAIRLKDGTIVNAPADGHHGDAMTKAREKFDITPDDVQDAGWTFGGNDSYVSEAQAKAELPFGETAYGRQEFLKVLRSRKPKPVKETGPKPKQWQIFGKHDDPDQRNAFDEMQADAPVAGQVPAETDTPGVDDNPIGKVRNWKAIVDYQAKKWGIEPKEYQSFADQVWDQKKQYIEEVDSARKTAAKSLGVNAGNIHMLENHGKDYTAIKDFDIIAERLANDYPVLGWKGLVGESGGELEQKLWDLLKSGKQAVPSKFSPEFHDEIDGHLNDLQQDQRSADDFNPDELEGQPPVEAPDSDVVPDSVFMKARNPAFDQELRSRIEMFKEDKQFMEDNPGITDAELVMQALEDIVEHGPDHSGDYGGDYAKSPDAKQWKAIYREAKKRLDSGDSLARTSTPESSQPGEQYKAVQMSPGAPLAAAKMEGDAEPGISAQGIVATLAKLFNLPIRSGRVQLRKALGIYKKREQVVRTTGQSSSDLPVIAHEVAHHLDFTTDVRRNKQLTPRMREELRNLDYDPQQKRAFEGFAEFVRLYLTREPGFARQNAPAFHDYFVNDWLPKHPESANKLEQGRVLIDRYLRQGAAARADAGISETGRPAEDYRSLAQKLPETIKNAFNRFYSRWKDKAHAVNLFDKAAREKGYKLQPGESFAYDLMSAFDQSGAPHAARALEDGVHLVTEGGEKIGPGMREILADIQEPEYQDFRRFLWARHAQEVYAKKPGMNPGIAQEDADFIVDAVKKDPAKLERFTKAAEGVTKFNHNLLDMLVDAGVIMPGSAEAMKKTWETYIPLFRTTEKGGGKFGNNLLDLPEPIRRRHGSGRQILDPIESTMQQAIAFYNVALKKQVQLQLIRQAKVGGLGGWVEKVPANMKANRVELADVWQAVAEKLNEMGVADITLDKETIAELGPEFAQDYLNIYRPDYSPSPRERIIRVVQDGQPALYQLDNDLYDGLEAMVPAQVPAFLKVFQHAAALVRLGATGLKSNFAVANVARDWVTYQVQSEHAKGAESLTDPFRWIGTYIASKAGSTFAGKEDDAVVKLWEEMGGQLASSLGQDRDSLRKFRNDLVAHSTKQHVKQLLIHPIHTLRDIIGAGEVGPRLAEFSNVLRENGYTRNKQGQIVNEAGEVTRPPRDVLVKAINAANDVTVNFKRTGSVGQLANRFIPFFNASLEGNDKRVRTLLGVAKREGNYKRAVIAMSSLAAATLAYLMVRGDDDDYKEQDDWLKYGYWTFTDSAGNPVIRIPKGYEYSFVPNFVEAVWNSVAQAKPSAAQDAAAYELRNLIPPTAPAVIKPLLESYFNWDFFRNKPIENQTLQRLRPGDRATNQTTGLMKAVGDFTNISPARLEHFVDQVSGGLYGNVYGTAERVATGNATAADIPAAGAFSVKRDYGKSVDDFYARKTELEQAAASAKADKAETADDREAKQALQKFSDYGAMMTDLRKLIPENASREQGFKVEKYIIGLARDALGEEPLNRYPSPLKRGADQLPGPIAAIVGKYRDKVSKR